MYFLPHKTQKTTGFDRNMNLLYCVDYPNPMSVIHPSTSSNNGKKQ